MKIRNLSFLSIVCFSIFLFFSCGKDEVEVLVDATLPQGTFTAVSNGNIVAQNSTNSKGIVTIGIDTKGAQFVKLSNDFETVLATGTVTVYLSTSAEFKANPGSGNPDLRLIGQIKKNGEQFFKLDPAAPEKFTHLILWCGTASIPFGYAKVK